MLRSDLIKHRKAPVVKVSPELSEEMLRHKLEKSLVAEYEVVLDISVPLKERIIRFLLAESEAGRLASVVKDFLLLFTPYGSHISKGTDFIAHIIEQKTKRNKPMNEKKPWYKSKTIIGAIVVILVIALNFFGIEVTEAEIQEAASAIITAVAAIVSIWGRISAEKKIDAGSK